MEVWYEALGFSILCSIHYIISGWMWYRGQKISPQPMSMKFKTAVTTQSQVLEWFGVAFKEGVRNGNPMWTYQFDLWHSLGDDESKELVILFDDKNVVQAYRYASNMD